ncbi:hypothetical protein G4H71_10020 [Rhodococcus triatomae]|uniref:MHYT domain-containing protein, NO-binding membrane sensor n=1 Tax=Rhodococcus triatomae TaxID=300028 RepID=A0A1G8QYH7_9NOCA|nr:hypothetical protein [Rhodococcus triatomae]QNG20761.1 hypothetical protein G4H72_20365 [Rhodococcus triatomae]QNG23323.1 hypothetical protein G4H71_10020 [Rhodococcus triatomae]SDJ09375.1 MHYT domain-containing protein, NO-binding membrane sensor [Rhodococcus triatomae]
MFSDQFTFFSAHIDYFTMGVWVVALAAGTSLLGAAVAVAGVNKAANTLSGRTRVTWLAWSAVSFGGVAAWLPYCVALVGLEVDGSRIRFDLVWLLAAAAIAVIGSGLAFVVIAPTRTRHQKPSTSPQWGRLIPSALLLFVTLGAMHVAVVSSIRIQGEIVFLVPMTVVAAVLAAVVAVGTVTAASFLDTRGRRLYASVGIAVGLAGVYYFGIFGIDAEVDPAVAVPEGVEMFGIALPVFVLSVLVMTIPITALLMAPDRVSAELESEADQLAAESRQLEKAGA